MAKYFIFENNSKNLAVLADSEDKKNKFLHLQTIYTAVTVNDNDYLDVKKGLKKTTLSNDNTALIENITAEDFEYLDNDNLDESKNKIKYFIETEISNWEYSNYSNAHAIISGLKQIDVDSLTSVSTGPLGQWLFSQPGISFNRPFEL